MDKTFFQQLSRLVALPSVSCTDPALDQSNLPVVNLLAEWLTEAGFRIRDICRCREYPEYLEMGSSAANIYTWKAAEAGALALEKRLGQKAVSLPVSFDYEEIEEEQTNNLNFTK